MYNTFNGWKRQGRVVIIGERGIYRNEYGDKMYHIGQTTHRGNSFYLPRIPQYTIVRNY